MNTNNMKKNVNRILGMIITLGCMSGLTAHAHPEKVRVSIEKEQETAVQAGVIKLDFQMIDTKQKKLLSDSDLDILHEKKLHFFTYDPALKEFRHEHPTFSNNLWHVELNLSVNGQYWLWAQGQLSSDGEGFTTSSRLEVVGGQATNPTPPVLGDVRTGTDAISKVTLSTEKLVAGKMAMPTLKFSRTDGSKPKITPYLGALAHVVLVAEDADSLIHVHPMASSDPTSLMLHTEFPRAGDYRLWVQFLDDGILRTVPLSVTVVKK